MSDQAQLETNKRPIAFWHWTEGGTMVTNFSEEDRPIYETAVKEFGDPYLVVHTRSVLNGKETDYGGSLHDVAPRELLRRQSELISEPGIALFFDMASRGHPSRDLSKFWALFDVARGDFRFEKTNAGLRHGT